jgi:tRNA A37 threonylcarbamoyladenosine dehydratase
MLSYEEIFFRTRLLIGNKASDALKSSSVVVTGVGGVGSYAAEAIARAGVGNIILIDPERIDATNINRQIHSTIDVIGEYKVNVMSKRIKLINPYADISIINTPFTGDKPEEFINRNVDYVIDAIDSIRDKINLIKYCKYSDIPIISCMGMGNKIDPTKIKVADIYDTQICPLAKIIRKEMRNSDIDFLKVVYSTETPLIRINDREIIASISFVPSAAGLIMASEAVKDIIDKVRF